MRLSQRSCLRPALRLSQAPQTYSHGSYERRGSKRKSIQIWNKCHRPAGRADGDMEDVSPLHEAILAVQHVAEERAVGVHAVLQLLAVVRLQQVIAEAREDGARPLVHRHDRRGEIDANRKTN